MNPTPKRYAELCVCEVCRRPYRADRPGATAHRCPLCEAAAHPKPTQPDIEAWNAEATPAEKARDLRKALKAQGIKPSRRPQLHVTGIAVGRAPSGYRLIKCLDCGVVFESKTLHSARCPKCAAESKLATAREYQRRRRAEARAAQ